MIRYFKDATPYILGLCAWVALLCVLCLVGTSCYGAVMHVPAKAVIIQPEMTLRDHYIPENILAEYIHYTEDDDPLVEETIHRFDRREFDVLVLEGVVVPLGTCDDLSDCADAIEEICEILGQEGEGDTSAVLNTNNGTCEGQCSGGHGVTVVCVQPKSLTYGEWIPN